MRKLDWYFDVISPFAYLQSEQLEELAQFGELRCKPVLFAGLLNHFGNVGPAEFAEKRRVTFERVAWVATRKGIPLQFPSEHPFNPIPLLRFVIASGCTRVAVHAAFRFVWQAGKLPSSHPEDFSALLTQFGLTDEQINAAPVKQALLDFGQEAIRRGVFGVPTTAVDDEIFWGEDSMEVLAAFCANDPFFQSGLLQAARSLPQGLQRKRSAP
ncbi:MAG: 2-hydroxychromene-2-carboxylate isomerase [Burkholderiales bacterium]|nr:MAG: 2-hydroxychromene-2-carboxylate isomerase [Burkholderiales bacterium]TAG83187.1 MAG: 2-hydroxychromene-2-carboxylate isomerase [Betaproteobacteria bacterium]